LHESVLTSDQTLYDKNVFRWVGMTLPPTVAIQKLSHAARVMNKVLLPAFLSHGSISTAKLSRRQKSVTTSALWKKIQMPQDTDLINEANKYRSSSNSVSDECRAGHSNKQKTTDEREAFTEILTNDSYLQSAVLYERFESWMDFVEVTSRVLAKDATSEIICESFLQAKPRSRSQHDALTTASLTRSLDLAAPQSPYRVESAAQGALCSSECLSDQSVTEVRPRKKLRQQPHHRNPQDAHRATIPLGGAAEGVSHSDAAVASFVRGIMSEDEATRIETELEGQRAKKEDSIQDQLKDLYAFNHQPLRDGGGRRKDDTVEDKVSVVQCRLHHFLMCLSIKVSWSIVSVHQLIPLSRLYSENDSQSRLLTLSIETLLGDVQGLVESLAILRAMPRSADV
jgi:hypothetical protein